MNRSFERVVAFAGDFSPLLALHALVPTLAAASGREPRLSIALPLSMNTLEKHFPFSRQALREGRWWTTASYILLHANQAHALSNLQSILVAGPAATETLGVNGAMVTYVAAGVAAALDPFVRTQCMLILHVDGAIAATASFRAGLRHAAPRAHRRAVGRRRAGPTGRAGLRLCDRGGYRGPVGQALDGS